MARTILLNVMMRDRISRRMSTMGRSTQNLRNEFAAMSRGSAILGNSLSAVEKGVYRPLKGMAVLSTATHVVISSFSALAAGAAHLISALGPVAASAAAIPGIFGAIGQGAFIVKFAMAGVVKALMGNAKAYQKLTPEAKRFVDQLHTLGPAFRKLRSEVQVALFKNLGREIRTTANVYMPLLKQAMVGGAQVINRFSVAFLKMVRSKAWTSDFKTITASNNRILSSLGGVMLNVANIVRVLWVAIGPLAERFANWMNKASGVILRLVETKRRTGELAAFMKRAGDAAAQWGRILGNLAVGLFNVFKIGSKSGQDMTNSLENMTRKFKEWTKSTQGQNSIAKWFKEGQETGKAFGSILGDLGRTWMQTFGQIDLSSKVNLIHKEWIPAIKKLMHAFADTGALNALIKAIGTWLDILAELASNGLMTLVINSFNLLGQTILWLVRYVPGAKQALQLLFAAVFAMKIAQLTGISFGFRAIAGAVGWWTTNTVIGAAAQTKLQAVLSLVWLRVRQATTAVLVQTWAIIRNTAAWIANKIQILAHKAISIASAIWSAITSINLQNIALTRNTFLWAANRIAIIAQTIVSTIAAVATERMRIAQLGLNRAMLSNPYVLAVAALIMLVVAIVIAYKKSETFRRIVNACFRGIAFVAKWWWNNIMKPILMRYGDVIKLVWTVMKLFWGFMVLCWHGIANAAKWAWEKVIKPTFRVLATMAGWVAAIFKFAFAVIVVIFRTLAAIAVWLWNSILHPIFNAIGAGALWLWNHAIRPALNAIAAAFRWLGNTVFKPVADHTILPVFRAIAGAANWLWNHILHPAFTFIGNGAKWLGSIIRAVFGAINGFFRKLSNAADYLLHHNVNAFDLIGKGVNWLKSRVSGALNAIVGFFKSAGKRISSAWSTAWNWIKNKVNGILGNVRGALSGFGKWIANKFHSIRNSIGGWWNSAWNWIKNTVGGAGGKVRNALSGFGKWVASKFHAIHSSITGWWNKAWNKLRGIMSSAWGHIRTTGSTIGKWLANKFHAIYDSLSGWWNKAWNKLRSIMSSAWGHIRTTGSTIGKWLGNKFHAIYNSLSNWWNKAWNKLRSIMSSAWGHIRTTGSTIGKWLGNKFHAIYNSLSNWWNKAWNKLRSIMSSAWGHIRTTGSTIGKWLGNKWHAIHNSLRDWWNRMWNKIRSIMSNAWSHIRTTASTIGKWLGNKWHAIHNSLRDWWNRMWNKIRSSMSNAWSHIRTTTVTIGKWMGNKFHSIHNSLTSWWGKLWDKVRSIFNWTWGKLRGSMNVMAKTMGNIWHKIVNTAHSVWEGIKKAIGRPINFVIGFVSDRLIPAANTILHAVHAGSLPSISKYKIPGVATGGIVGSSGIDRGYAAGGILPGYSPGRDIYIAQSPLGPIGLSGGEGILRPEVMRTPGMANFLHGANKRARRGGISAVRDWIFGGSVPGQANINRNTAIPGEGIAFARGGIIPTVANFDGGGIFGKLKDWGGKAMSIVNPIGKIAAKKAKEFVWDKGGLKLLEAAVGKVWSSLSNWISGRGVIGKGIAGVGKRILDGVFTHVDSKTAPPGMGGITWTNASARLKKAMAWAKTQNGKPYQWGGGGNPSWDCSGFQAGIQSVIMGQSPHRMYTTFDFHGKSAPAGWQQNLTSPFMVGVTNAGVGHMAGTLLGTNVESSGSHGVRVGGPARGYDNKMFRDRYGFKPVVKDARMVSSGNFGPGGWAKAYFTMFNDSNVASGGGMTPDTVASSYIPLGSRVAVAKGGHQAQGTIRDLGPAKFVYDRHPGMAVLDLSPQLSNKMGGDGVGQWKLLSVGHGGTLYGKRLRGYSSGGTISANTPSLVGEMGPEVIRPNTSATVHSSGTTVSVGDTHVHFHDKVYVKSEKDFESMVITAIAEAKRKRKI